MVCKIFYNSKTAKSDSNVTNIGEIYGCNDVSMHFFIIFNIPSFIRINIMQEGNKQEIFNFISFFNLPKTTSAGP